MSLATEPRTLLTPEEFLRLPDSKEYELIDGVPMPRHRDHEGRPTVSLLSSLVASRINHRLVEHCEPTGVAWVFESEAGFQCFPGRPGRVRRPDVSVVLRERLPLDRIGEGWATIPPDIAIEVVSPHDLAREVSEKVDDYLSAGVRLIWVLGPELRIVHVYRIDGSVSLLRAADTLGGEDVLPGFACPVAELFPALPAAEAAPPA